MVDHWASSPDNWEDVGMYKAHELANQGYFVVAGAKAGPGETSGHVVVIVPSDKKEGSKSWGCDVPMAMDTGQGQRWPSKALSYSWVEERKEDVKFFRYKGPIKK